MGLTTDATPPQEDLFQVGNHPLSSNHTYSNTVVFLGVCSIFLPALISTDIEVAETFSSSNTSSMMAFPKKVGRIIIDFFRSPRDPGDAEYDQALETYSTYQTTHNLEDLIISLERYNSALISRRKSKDQTDLPSLLVNYAVALWSRYKEEPGSMNDTKKIYLMDAIKFYEEARKLWKADPPVHYLTLLMNLANAYFELARVDPTQETTSLTQSLALNREVFYNPSYPEEKRYTAAFEIGKSLWIRYELKTKNPELKFPDENSKKKGDKVGMQIGQLDEAITKFKESLDYADAHNNSQTRVACYYFMAKAYDARYTLRKQITDLDTAIDYNRKARKELDKKDQRLETCSYDLCLQILRKYDSDKEKNCAHLEEAKAIAQGKFDDILKIIHDREHRM